MRTRANLRERTQLLETKFWWVKRIFFHQTIFIMINRTDLIRRHNLHPIFIIFMKLVKRHHDHLHPTIIILSKAQQLGLFPRGQLSGAITEVFHCIVIIVFIIVIFVTVVIIAIFVFVIIALSFGFVIAVIVAKVSESCHLAIAILIKISQGGGGGGDESWKDGGGTLNQ